MNHLISSMVRNKFWLVFLAFFVFWYLLLYGFDWSSFLGLTSLPPHPEDDETIQSLVKTESNRVADQEEEKRVLVSSDSGNSTFSIDNNNSSSSNVVVDGVDKNNNNNTDGGVPEKDEDVEDLENELEPFFEKVDSKYAEEERDKPTPEPLPEKDDSGYAVSETIDEEIEEDDESEPEPDDSAFNVSEPIDEERDKLCNGRYIYVHKLPSRFNERLLNHCKSLIPWTDMCKYLVNNGLGEDLGNPGRIFSKTSWFNTHQFSLEVIFHNKMKQYDCLTNYSAKAAAVYVPYYAGLDVSRFLWGHASLARRDADAIALARWLRKRPQWDVMSGRDHFTVAGRITWDFRRGSEIETDWGNKFLILPEIRNMTVLTVESSPWNRNDFAIPYPTYFHPWNDNDVLQWQNRMRKLKRKYLFCFAGGPRPDSIRGQITDQCRSAKRKCALMECSNSNTRNRCQKPDQLMRLFQNSIFCLQPPGDSATRRSTFDAILAGCIPVFFTPESAYVQYLWHLPKNFKSYSVLIPESDVKKRTVSIESVLSRIPRTRVNAMMEEVIKLIPNVVYADPRSKSHKFEDAFDIAVKGVIERVASLKQEIDEGRDSSVSFGEENSWKYYTFGTVEKHEWDHFFVGKH